MKKQYDVIMAEFSDVRFDARVLKQAHALAETGHLVALLMYNAAITEDRVRQDGNITYREYSYKSRLANRSFFGQTQKYLRAIVITMSISLWILSHRARYYHAHNLLFLPSFVLASRLYRAKLVYDAHEIHCEHYERTSFKGRSKNWINEKIERICLRFCDAYIQASEERAQYISRRYGIPLPYVINNYVPLRFSGEQRSRRIQQELGLSGDNPVMFYSGGIYLGGNRRLDKVFQALALVPNVDLVIVGFMNDSIRSQLQDYIDELGLKTRVHVLPPCPSEELHEYASSADFGVIPLAGESLNNRMSALNKLSEYLMAGLPFICSDYDNLRKIVHENPVGHVGEVFDINSTHSIQQAIKKLVAGRRFESLRGNALALGRQHMNWEREKETLLNIYAKIGN